VCLTHCLVGGRWCRPAGARTARLPEPGPVVSRPRHARGGGSATASHGGHSTGDWSWPGARRPQWCGHAAGRRWGPGAAGHYGQPLGARGAGRRVRSRTPAAVDADCCAGSRQLGCRHRPVDAGVGPTGRALNRLQVLRGTSERLSY
jgi:hypothetical protein